MLTRYYLCKMLSTQTVHFLQCDQYLAVNVAFLGLSKPKKNIRVSTIYGSPKYVYDIIL